MIFINIFIEILKEYGIYLFTSTGIFLSILFNRPKTAEKLKKIEEKNQDKLAKKGVKYAKKGVKCAEKATVIYKQLKDEVDNNGRI